MGNKYDLMRHIEDVTQVEISAAIRYLDPDPRSTTEQGHATGVAICIILMLLILGCMVFTFLHP